MKHFVISGSPHVHTDETVNKLMRGVIIAMIPAVLVSLYMFGLGAMRIFLVSIVSCLAFEYVIQKYLIKGEVTITDGSAMVSAILLAFNVPSSLPSWIVIIGALVTIGIGKMTFGGLGNNPFNPVLVGRVVMLVSFPVQMTTWPKPILSRGFFFFPGEKEIVDSLTGPTYLGIIKEQGASAAPGYMDQLIGQAGGSLGEISAIAIILGGLYLLYKHIITWHIPVSFIGAAMLFSGILWLVNPSLYADPLLHLLTGGLLLGAFFMATDYVTSPVSPRGQLVFGACIGILTILIRTFGAYPEGVSFAIIIMNAFTPLINSYFKPKRFGH